MAEVNFESPVPSSARRTLFGTCLDRQPKMEYEPYYMSSFDDNGENNQRVVQLSDLRQSYENQKQRLQQIDKDMKQKQDKALRFQTPTPAVTNPTFRRIDTSVPVLNDLFKPKPAKLRQSQYAYPYKIMGDVFCSGSSKAQSSTTPLMDTTPRYGRQSGAQMQGFDADFLTHRSSNTNNNSNNTGALNDSGPSSQIKIPPNIKHSFGSRICNELLSDPVKVSETLEKQKKSKRTQSRQGTDVPSMLKTPLNPYEDLGHNTRLNLFPGLSVGHEISATKTYHNEEVFLNREPDPDKYRMKKDELSTWAERNVIRERLKKAWDQSHETGGKKD